MNSSNFIPHHLFVSAVGRPVRAQRKPNRDLLDPARLADQAMSVSLELLDVGKQMPLLARRLRVSPQTA